MKASRHLSEAVATRDDRNRNVTVCTSLANFGENDRHLSARPGNTGIRSNVCRNSYDTRIFMKE